MENTRGRFFWYDLLTTDIEGAKAFYTKLAGWQIEMWSAGPTPYPVFRGPRTMFGGVMDLPEEAKKMGAPPNWMAYVGTPDIQATVKLAEQLGGGVVHPAMPIPKVGTFAILRDPQGAVFAAFQPERDAPEPQSLPQIGEFSWHELATTDSGGAVKFYQDLFGWEKLQSFDMGPQVGAYEIFGRNGVALGGIFKKPAHIQAPPYWLYYIKVKNVAESLKQALALGGRVLMGPTEVPDGDMIAQLTDPQGAMFALHASKG